jgi:hypothetical protein
LTTGVPADPSSTTSTRIPPGSPRITTVTLPPGRPESVCRRAFVTSSDVSNVAASESMTGSPAASVRATNLRTSDTCSGSPATVTDPRIEARGVESDLRWRPPATLSICWLLPIVQ